VSAVVKVGVRAGSSQGGLCAAPLRTFLELLGVLVAPHLTGEARQPEFAHLDRCAGVPGPIKDEGKPVEGPGKIASPVNRFAPQTHSLVQPSNSFKVAGEVVGHPPEELRSRLLACSLHSGCSDSGRVHVVLGGGERLGESVSLVGQARHIVACAAGDHGAPDGERVVATPPRHQPATEFGAKASVCGEVAFLCKQREDGACPTLDEFGILVLVDVEVNMGTAPTRRSRPSPLSCRRPHRGIRP
jgi:hypothetical protein